MSLVPTDPYDPAYLVGIDPEVVENYCNPKIRQIKAYHLHVEIPNVPKLDLSFVQPPTQKRFLRYLTCFPEHTHGNTEYFRELAQAGWPEENTGRKELRVAGVYVGKIVIRETLMYTD